MELKNIIDFKNLDKKLLKKLGIFLGAFVVVVIILFIVVAIITNKLSYNDVEKRMVDAAKRYYADNEKELPKLNNETKVISSDKLIQAEYLKDLDKLIKNDNANCSGQVSITKNDKQYFYSATLSCGDLYETRKLKDVITKDIAKDRDGLYEMNNSYIFRGDNVKNYINFADKTWRILRINGDGSIRIIDASKYEDETVWDDRYNTESESYDGINDYMVSRIKDNIKDLYAEFSNKDKSYMLKQNLCIGKRSINETNNDGSIECSNTLENQNLGLLSLNEFLIASLSDKCTEVDNIECSNYNYLADIGSFWTITADKDTTSKVYKVSSTAFLTDAANYSYPRMVVNINPNVNYTSGNGTEEKPYTFN